MASSTVNMENSSNWKGNSREVESFSEESLSRVACTFDSKRESQLGLHEKQEADKGDGLGNVDEGDVEVDKVPRRLKHNGSGPSLFSKIGPNEARLSNGIKGPNSLFPKEDVVTCSNNSKGCVQNNLLVGTTRKQDNRMEAPRHTKTTENAGGLEHLSFDSECKRLKNSKKVRKKSEKFLTWGRRSKISFTRRSHPFTSATVADRY